MIFYAHICSNGKKKNAASWNLQQLWSSSVASRCWLAPSQRWLFQSTFSVKRTAANIYMLHPSIVPYGRAGSQASDKRSLFRFMQIGRKKAKISVLSL